VSTIILNGSSEVMEGLCLKLQFVENPPLFAVEDIAFKIDAVDFTSEIECQPITSFTQGCPPPVTPPSFKWPTDRFVAGLFPMSVGARTIRFEGDNPSPIVDNGFVEDTLTIVEIPSDVVALNNGVLLVELFGTFPVEFNAPGAITVEVIHVPGPTDDPEVGRGFVAIPEGPIASITEVVLTDTSVRDGDYILRVRFRAREGSSARNPG